MIINYLKKADYLVPATDEDEEKHEKLGKDKLIAAKIAQKSNPGFHRKVFALFKLGFDAWEPDVPVYKGQEALKEFNRFRNDITILAGYYDTVININGEARVEAKSLSFDKMDDDVKQGLYVAISTVLLQRTLGSTWSQEKIDEYIDEVLSFK